MLEPLGMDSTSEAIYRAMLVHNGEPLADLVRHMGLDRTEIDLAVGRLRDLGLVRPSLERAGQLWAIEPLAKLEALLARRQADLNASGQRLEKCRAAVADLIAEHTKRQHATALAMDRLAGPDQVQDRLVTLSRTARSEVVGLFPDVGRPGTSADMSRHLNRLVLEQEIPTRWVYLDSVRNSRPTLGYLDRLAERGAQIRTAATLPTSLIIFDRTTALIPANPHDKTGAHVRQAAAFVVVSLHGIVDALHALFDMVWDMAQAIGRPLRSDARGLTSQRAAFMRLLGEGLTDEAIANRLGISARSARRIASTLMEQLGARSRFQAGVRAAQRGWLDTDTEWVP